ncbi:hypothetical protein NS506_06362 [Nocardia seriolae]|nr:hypothetical protein NS506_06362 [Nocardia seriolae]
MPQRGTRTRAVGSRGPRRRTTRVLPPNPRDEGLGVMRATMRRHVELAAGRQPEPDESLPATDDAHANAGRDAYTSSGRDHYVYRPRAEYSAR